MNGVMADEERGTVKDPPLQELDVRVYSSALKSEDTIKSEGSWLHCAYHLTTSIVSPAVLSIPSALALIGWVGGVISLTLFGIVTFYSYVLLSKVLEHNAKLGKLQARFLDLATDILGPAWGKCYVGPIQLGLCYGAVIAFILVGGQSLKFIYTVSNPNGTMKLYHFTFIFGVLVLILAQMPSLHSLRHINFISLHLCLAYSFCAAAGSIYIGNSKNEPSRDYYSINGDENSRIFSTFNAISIIITTYSSGVYPEIQATIGPPVKGKMFKGLCTSYIVIVSTVFSVGMCGYWAFGNQTKGTILANFVANNKPLLPTWFIFLINVFALLQVSAAIAVYLQPTNELFEKKFADPKTGQFSVHNITQRLISRSLSVIIATILATMLPFFGDIIALFGAFACIPLNIVLPIVFYNLTFKPSKRSLIFWGNTFIAVISSVLAAIGTIASIRQIVIDAKYYRLFANV